MQKIRFQNQINGPIFNVQNKESLRQEIAEKTEEFKKKGGKITQLKPNQYHGPLRGYNNKRKTLKAS